MKSVEDNICNEFMKNNEIWEINLKEFENWIKEKYPHFSQEKINILLEYYEANFSLLLTHKLFQEEKLNLNESK